VFRRVGFGLPRVPLEHLFSIYGILDAVVDRDALPSAFRVGGEGLGGAGTPPDAKAASGVACLRSLRLHNGSKIWDDSGVRRRSREDSVTTSKVPRISSLRQKRASLEIFPNCRYEVATPGAS
jgi:hypothetical protein